MENFLNCFHLLPFPVPFPHTSRLFELVPLLKGNHRELRPEIKSETRVFLRKDFCKDFLLGAWILHGRAGGAYQEERQKSWTLKKAVYLIKSVPGHRLIQEMAPHSSTLAWKIPWTEKPGGLQCIGSLRVGHGWVTSLSLFTFMHWRRKWQPTPVCLENPRDGGAWWAAIYGVAQSRKRLKWLSSSSREP